MRCLINLKHNHEHCEIKKNIEEITLKWKALKEKIELDHYTVDRQYVSLASLVKYLESEY